MNSMMKSGHSDRLFVQLLLNVHKVDLLGIFLKLFKNIIMY